MSMTGALGQTMRIGSLMMQGTLSKTEDGVIEQQPTLPAGSAGVMTDKTDADTGKMTLVGTHGITTDDFVDIFWADGCRYGCDVTVVSGQDVTVDVVGFGDDLPANTTVLVCTKRVTIDTDFDGDLMEMLGMCLQTCTRGHVEFLTEADVSKLAVELVEGQLYNFVKDVGANPLTGDPVGKLQISNGTTTAGVLNFGVLYDSAS